MKKKKRILSARQIILGISGAVSFLVCLLLWAGIEILINKQPTQQMAERWSKEGEAAQVSCFFSSNAMMDTDSIEMFRHTLDNALLEASIVQDSPNPGARLWADAYSADGKISLKTDRTTLEADAIGIGGDFFLFHPLTLISGSYFSGSDLNQDYCVIDEDAAWQLFGSNDVTGMTVTINGIPHIVTGVIHRDTGRMAKEAGLDTTVVYVSYSTLSELGSSNGINHYEIVMPNPVSHYAYQYIADNIGVEEKEVEIVENSDRFSLLSRLKLLLAFGTRSMNGKAIIYPYWENVARGYEDILTLLTFFEVLFFLYPVLLIVITVIRWWKHKTWTVKGILIKIKEKGENLAEKLRKRRSERPKDESPKDRKERKKKEREIKKEERERKKEEKKAKKPPKPPKPPKLPKLPKLPKPKRKAGWRQKRKKDDFPLY